MFELARGGDGSAVQEILAKSRQIGVKVEEFLNTLLGKWVLVFFSIKVIVWKRNEKSWFEENVVNVTRCIVLYRLRFEHHQG